MHPAGRIDGGPGRRFIVPVAEHHHVPTAAELAPLPARKAELEENLRRENLTWQEESAALAEIAKVESELAELLDKLPNKSAFIRNAIAAQLGVACPLCGLRTVGVGWA